MVGDPLTKDLSCGARFYCPEEAGDQVFICTLAVGHSGAHGKIELIPSNDRASDGRAVNSKGIPYADVLSDLDREEWLDPKDAIDASLWNKNNQRREINRLRAANAAFSAEIDRLRSALLDAGAADGPAEQPVEISAQQPGLKGPIKVGQCFIWEPNNPKAWAKVEVTRITEIIGSDEKRIWTKTLSGNGPTKETWNDESRFREACFRASVETNEQRCQTLNAGLCKTEKRHVWMMREVCVRCGINHSIDE